MAEIETMLGIGATPGPGDAGAGATAAGRRMPGAEGRQGSRRRPVLPRRRGSLPRPPTTAAPHRPGHRATLRHVSEERLVGAARPATVAAAVARAVDGLEALAELGEQDEDAWQYVVDLAAAWRARLEAVAEARGPEPLEPAVAAAVETALEEARLIRDPYRAIDWCSTLPQVVLTALGERP